MIAAFLIWSAVTLLFLGAGIAAWRAQKPAGFFTSVKPPQVTDVKKYNRAVAVLWFTGAVVFEVLGLPLLFARQNSPLLIPVGLGTAFLAIGMMIAYSRIEAKYRSRP